jgi:hypothetical protein
MMSEELGQGGAETGKGPSGGLGGDSAGPDREIQAARSALRRRMLLRGLVVAPATLAVMRPVKTLAKATKVCSYSGWHSFKVTPTTSAHPNDHCKTGYNINFYYSKYRTKLPKSKTKNGRRVTSPYSIAAYNGSVVSLYQTTTFNQLFGGTGGTVGHTAETLLYWLGQSSSNQAAYLAALFNANYFHGSGYPYTVANVYAYWTDPASLSSDTTPALSQSDVALFFNQLDSFG